MKCEVKRIDLASLAKVALFLNAALGFLIGIPVGFLFYLGSQFPGMGETPPLPSGLAFFMPFILMLFYGLVNTIFALLAGLFYNLVGGFIGGVVVEIGGGEPETSATTSTASPDLSKL
jgi:hypothetical protein